MTLQDASRLVRTAVDQTIEALDTKPEDAAAIRLARYYADQIDAATATGNPKIEASTARWIAPQLLDVLEALGATPAARSRLKKGEPVPHGESKLTALRAARR